jgi:hypothetical protein
VTHCLQNINKRLSNLHESVSQFLPDVISIMPQYLRQSVDKELPGSNAYRRYRYKDREPGITTIISDLFHFCTLQSQNELNPRDIGASHQIYAFLDLAAGVLVRSRFLNERIHDSSDPVRMTRAEKLKRRLLKVCQYYTGIAGTHQKVEAVCPNRPIPYRWANLAHVREEGTVEISSQVEVALQRVPPLITEEAMVLLMQRFPAMFQRCRSSFTVHSCRTSNHF